MEIKPVKKMEKPKYPVKEDVTINELKASVPKRWASGTAAKVALGTLAAMSLAGCTPPIETTGAPTPPAAQTEETASLTQDPRPTITFMETAGVPAAIPTPVIEDMPMGEPAMPMVSIAPLFIHGAGRGAFGCDMVTPPAFMSEDEALDVINEAAKEYGLNFSDQDSPIFLNVTQPVTNLYDSDEKQSSDRTMELNTDYADKQYGIAIEFVSIDDVKKWHREGEFVSSVEEYDAKDAADQLKQGLQNATNMEFIDYTAGVMYDPCSHAEGVQTEESLRALSVSDLKAQVKDFFEWLKSEGII